MQPTYVLASLCLFACPLSCTFNGSFLICKTQPGIREGYFIQRTWDMTDIISSVCESADTTLSTPSSPGRCWESAASKCLPKDGHDRMRQLNSLRSRFCCEPRCGPWQDRTDRGRGRRSSWGENFCLVFPKIETRKMPGNAGNMVVETSQIAGQQNQLGYMMNKRFAAIDCMVPVQRLLIATGLCQGLYKMARGSTTFADLWLMSRWQGLCIYQRMYMDLSTFLQQLLFPRQDDVQHVVTRCACSCPKIDPATFWRLSASSHIRS